MDIDTELHDRDPVEALGEEFLIRRRSGEQVRINDYADAHPAMSDGIRRHFRTILALEKFKTCTSTSDDKSIQVKLGPLDQLGDFQIIRELGRGGMGVVYEAEQQSLRRRVAVKVFPGEAIAGQQQLNRFHREAQTAARLHHTNIVPVFGVGEQDGLHYFVMQRIYGNPLDRVIDGAVDPMGHASQCYADTNILKLGSASTKIGHSDSNKMSRSESESDQELNEVAEFDHPELELATDAVHPGPEWQWAAHIGIQVAEAVSYAHAQGVLHRDIKPANLILDRTGVVWVTDFGLAALMNLDDVSDRGKIIGTLRFMAPEQIGGSQDARSDIYCIGTTLYELITKKPAFESESRVKLIDKIFKGDFRPPRSVRPAVPRDLEAIVLKAMSREPEMRYSSAEGLAADLRRFTEGRPVRARPIGPPGRLTRWARRNPVIATLTAALLLGAIVSFAVISTEWRDAVAENRRAEENLSLALESLDRILERYSSGWMAAPTSSGPQVGDEVGEVVSIRMVVSDHNAAVLRDALRFYDEFVKKNPTAPRIQLDIAKVHRRVADIYLRLGQNTNAEKAYQRSLAILDTQPTGGELPMALERARIRNQLGLARHASSRFRDACFEFERAQTLLSAAKYADDTECQAELARTFTNLGHSQWLMLQHADARQSHRRSISILEDIVRESSDQPAYRLALARSYRAYYPLATRRQDDERGRIRREGVALLESLVKGFPDVPDYQCELSEMLSVTAHRGRGSQITPAEIEQLQRGIAIARNLTEMHPSIPQYRAVLARGLKESSRRMRHADAKLAEEHIEESLTLYRSLAGEFPRTPAYRILLAMTLQDQAETLGNWQRYDEARNALEEGIEAQRSYAEMRPGNRFGNTILSNLYDSLSTTLAALEEPEASDAAKQAAERIRTQLGITERSG